MFNQNVVNNDLEGVRKDLDVGVLDLKDNFGSTHLKIAIKNQNHEMVKLFIENRSNILDGTHLTEACKNDNVDIVKYILGLDVDPNYKQGLPLISASKKGKIENVKQLLNKRANVNHRNNQAIEMAALNGHLDIVKILIQFGADRHIHNEAPLAYAAEEGHLDVVNYLLSFNDIEIEECMALDFAVMENHVRTAEALINYGFAPHKRHMEKAMFYDNLDMCKMLKERGVNIEDDFVKNIKSKSIKYWWFK